MGTAAMATSWTDARRVTESYHSHTMSNSAIRVNATGTTHRPD
ncbi:hypothetical protein P3T29_001763 [Kitasatospora sp. MAP5-34]|nr:hypothetical protein [Kitasatospora sp. MAP5-34]